MLVSMTSSGQEHNLYILVCPEPKTNLHTSNSVNLCWMLGERTPVVIICNRKRFKQAWLIDLLMIEMTGMISRGRRTSPLWHPINFWFLSQYRVAFADLAWAADQVLRYRNAHLWGQYGCQRRQRTCSGTYQISFYLWVFGKACNFLAWACL